jgi:hypothetical protein
VNDIVLTAVAHLLSELLARVAANSQTSKQVPRSVQIVVPVSLRWASTNVPLENRFGMTLLELDTAPGIKVLNRLKDTQLKYDAFINIQCAQVSMNTYTHSQTRRAVYSERTTTTVIKACDYAHRMQRVKLSLEPLLAFYTSEFLYNSLPAWLLGPLMACCANRCCCIVSNVPGTCFFVST